MEVTPGQDTTYYLLIDGQVAQINNTWTPNSGMDTLPATANVYVYDPDDVVKDLMYGTNYQVSQIRRWADGNIRIYNTTTCPDQNIQEAIDFWNSKLPDNVNLTMTNDPNSWDIVIEDASNNPNPPGAAWVFCQTNEIYEFTDCTISVYDMESVCNLKSPYYTYMNSVGAFAHELGHALGMYAHPGTDETGGKYLEEHYDLERRQCLMGFSKLDSGLEDRWTPLLDIFFRHLYSMPPGTCMDAGLCS